MDDFQKNEWWGTESDEKEWKEKWMKANPKETKS